MYPNKDIDFNITPKKNKEIVIAGDFNYDLLSYTKNERINDFVEICMKIYANPALSNQPCIIQPTLHYPTNPALSNQPCIIQPTLHYPTNPALSNQPCIIQPTLHYPTNTKSRETKPSFLLIPLKALSVATSLIKSVTIFQTLL